MEQLSSINERFSCVVSKLPLKCTPVSLTALLKCHSFWVFRIFHFCLNVLINQNKEINNNANNVRLPVRLPSFFLNLWNFRENFTIHFPGRTEQKIKFSVKNFFSKCDRIRKKLWIWSHLAKKFLMEKIHFLCSADYINNTLKINKKVSFAYREREFYHQKRLVPVKCFPGFFSLSSA